MTRGVVRGAIVGLLLAVGWAIGAGPVPAGRAETAVARDKPVLVIDGALVDRKPAVFDLAALRALPAITVKTTTPWLDGENDFQGVRLRDLLDRLGAQGTEVIAAAVDEYYIPIPMEDIRDHDVIVAYAMNGRLLPVDDRGPLWIIYPFDSDPVLQKDLYFSRSVWQLKRLTVQ